MYSRTTDDYEKMSLAGIEVIVQPSFWLGFLEPLLELLKIIGNI